MLGLDSLCTFQWELALGDATLTPEEFRRIAALKVPLVQVRGQWVELRPEDLQALAALLKSGRLEGEMDLRSALRIASGLETTHDGVPVVSVVVDGWIRDLLERSGDTELAAVPAPASFQGQLRPYQERGLAWLAGMDRLGLGAILADDMGLGKTIQLLALLLHERQGKTRRHSPTLLVCPMSVVGNWQRETARFAPSLKVLVHHGAGRTQGVDLRKAAKEADIVITTYSLVHRDQEDLSQVKWARLVLDEAQNTSPEQMKMFLTRLGFGSRAVVTGDIT